MKHRSTQSLMDSIPEHLRVKILYFDEAVIVIDKPCNLRSVPGHANPPPAWTTRRFDPDVKKHRLTGQESWITAIQSFGGEDGGDVADSWLRNLATRSSLVSVPRKWNPFHRYVLRNRQRLQLDTFIIQRVGHEKQSEPKSVGMTQLEGVIRTMYERIKKRQLPLMNLPERTNNQDSVLGQLILLGFADSEAGVEDASRDLKQLYVVHRLDCEASGVMVFARNKDGASKLSRAWREHCLVSNVYLARVKHWPPYHNNTELEGQIDEPLMPSEERLQWKVDSNGKPCTTLWQVQHQSSDNDSERTNNENDSVTLELTPVTGRTHQLRVHCASVGSGIEGDSLYGDEPIEWNPAEYPGTRVLCLHAHKLSFPHPSTGELMEFVSLPCWHGGEM